MFRLHTYDERNISFYNYDEHIKKIKQDDMVSILDLVKYMEKPIPKDNLNRDLYMARSILVWMTCMIGWEEQLSEEIDELTTRDPADLFQVLCQCSDIECKTISGKVKAAAYVPGETDIDTVCQTSWNSFRSGNTWHLVHPVWATRSLIGHTRGGEAVLATDEGQSYHEVEAQAGYTTSNFEEFWFCIKPEILIIHAFPDDENWQLLPKANEITACDFLSTAFLEAGFFKSRLQLITENKCALVSKKGRCIIAFEGEPAHLKNCTFRYLLSFVIGTGELSSVDLHDVPRMVMHSPGINTATFTIRLPVTGEYMFKIALETSQSDSSEFCGEFKIICHEAAPMCQPFPEHDEELGFGYGHVAREIGLLMPSQTTPTVTVNDLHDEVSGPKQGTLRFKIDHDRVDELDFTSSFIGTVQTGYTETKVDKEKGNLEIRANLDQEGEFAVVVKAKDKTAKEEFKPIMNYLVSTYENDEGEHEQLIKSNRRKLALGRKTEVKMEMKLEVSTRIDNTNSEIRELKQLLGMPFESNESESMDEI